MSSRFLSACAIASTLLLTSACSHDPETLKRDHMARGDQFVAAKNFDAAIIEYRNAIQQDPKFTEAYRKLTPAYLARGDARSALRSAEMAAELAPEMPAVQLEAGNLLILAGRFNDAKVRAEKALTSDPKNVQARILLGNAIAGLKDVDSAIKEFEAAIRLDPTLAGGYTSLAIMKATQGDMNAAERSFRDAINADPKSVAARLALAQFYLSRQRLADAEQTMQQALAVSPRDQLANLAMAVLYQGTNRKQEAERYLRAAVDADPTPRVTLSLADYYIGQRRLDDAEPLLQKIQPDPHLGTMATLRLATIELLRGRPDDSLRTLDKVLAVEPKNGQALAAKADVLRQQHLLDDALRTIDASIAAEPTLAEAHFIRGRILGAKAQTQKAEQAFNEVLRLNPRAAAAQVELARLRLSTGATDRSITLATEATRMDPRSVDAKLVLAHGLILHRDYEQADTILKSLVEAVPKVPAVHTEMGLLRAAKHDHLGARQSFTRALDIDPVYPAALGGLTALDIAAGKIGDATSRLDRLVAASPKDSGLLVIAAKAELHAKNPSKAEGLLIRAIDANPSALAAYSLLGQLYLSQKKLDAALVQFQKLADTQDRPVGALTIIGMIYQIQGRTADARTAFERVLTFDASAGVAANNLAFIYAENDGNVDLALQLAQTAKSALPNQAEVHDTLGWIYVKKNELPLAVASLRRSLELDPANLEASYHLGLAYEKQGNRADARRMLEQYLRLDSTSDRSTEVRRRLAAFGA
jgi:tetratricopeptide (TPR) repeat protein